MGVLFLDPLDAWREWRLWLLASDFSPYTARSYCSGMLRFFAEAGLYSPDRYSESDLTRFLSNYAPRGSAKRLYVVTFRSFFSFCAKRGYSEDIAAEVVSKKPRRVPPVVLTYSELVCLLIAAVYELDERPAWCILLTYLLGLRRLEAVGLRWEDIREGASGPVMEIRNTKGADQRDPIPLTPLALECLARIRELPANYRSMRDEDYIFRVGSGTFSGWVRKAGVAAELPNRKIGAHRLRASLATHMLRAGVDVRVVQKTLGHLRLESTSWYLEEADEVAVRNGLDKVGYAV